MYGRISRALSMALITMSLALVGGTAVDVAASPVAAPAAAAANRVCHDGPSTNRPVYIHEQDGSYYWLHPGQCTDGVVSILRMRPVSGMWMFYRFWGSDTLRKYNGWLNLNGRSASIVRTSY